MDNYRCCFPVIDMSLYGKVRVFTERVGCPCLPQWHCWQSFLVDCNNDYSAIYDARNLQRLLSPEIKQSPKQMNRRPAVVMGAATEPAAHSQPRWLPLQQKSRRWFQPGSFVEVPMGAMIKTVQLTEGCRQPSPSLDSSTTCRPCMGNWGGRGNVSAGILSCWNHRPPTQMVHSI